MSASCSCSSADCSNCSTEGCSTTSASPNAIASEPSEALERTHPKQGCTPSHGQPASADFDSSSDSSSCPGRGEADAAAPAMPLPLSTPPARPGSVPGRKSGSGALGLGLVRPVWASVVGCSSPRSIGTPSGSACRPSSVPATAEQQSKDASCTSPLPPPTSAPAARDTTEPPASSSPLGLPLQLLQQLADRIPSPQAAAQASTRPFPPDPHHELLEHSSEPDADAFLAAIAPTPVPTSDTSALGRPETPMSVPNGAPYPPATSDPHHHHHGNYSNPLFDGSAPPSSADCATRPTCSVASSPTKHHTSNSGAAADPLRACAAASGCASSWSRCHTWRAEAADAGSDCCSLPSNDTPDDPSVLLGPDPHRADRADRVDRRRGSHYSRSNLPRGPSGRHFHHHRRASGSSTASLLRSLGATGSSAISGVIAGRSSGGGEVGPHPFLRHGPSGSGSFSSCGTLDGRWSHGLLHSVGSGGGSSGGRTSGGGHGREDEDEEGGGEDGGCGLAVQVQLLEANRALQVQLLARVREAAALRLQLEESCAAREEMGLELLAAHTHVAQLQRQLEQEAHKRSALLSQNQLLQAQLQEAGEAWRGALEQLQDAQRRQGQGQRTSSSGAPGTAAGGAGAQEHQGQQGQGQRTGTSSSGVPGAASGGEGADAERAHAAGTSAKGDSNSSGGEELAALRSENEALTARLIACSLEAAQAREREEAARHDARVLQELNTEVMEAVNTLSLELSLLRPHACGRVKGILNRTFSSRI